MQAGNDVVIERDAKPWLYCGPLNRGALPRDSAATVDPDFAADVQMFIDRHREPVNPTEWD